ncbi:hypothetical protein COEREDRAFT_89689 [Coemansia reversa NRRL 1564]|uniref:DUF2423 domain-containing protein n=1 Tax=Coemansia reversa (strain ATCC 12441 / NRRL 1564) TaxID=763665 RepID=A0A2G5B2U4_COERN|nr:hypothetical protein COEREDRAFT_89689 [Coemansia reversa NRRL 1564]|eukprot:PIA13340.1 hypothetical protein COEREDRAFT_89689 [Coemansia reversa NRRL 1564]
MGKSIRSKSKIRNRNALRVTVFGPKEAERIQRLAAKQRVSTGSTADLMETDQIPLTTTEDTVDTSTSDVEMNTGEALSGKSTKSKKRGKHAKPRRGVVRNSKGRVQTRNAIKWVKNKTFK